MKTKILIAALAGVAVLGSSAAAQTIAITGGKVYPVSGAPIENGTVLIRGGKIVAVGSNVAIPGDATRIDASGKIVTPGLVHAATSLGLSEIGLVRETNENTARGKDQIAAAFRVWEGLNTQSMLFTPTREEGITSVMIYPSSGFGGGAGLVQGQAALLSLVPGTVSDMLLKGPVAMVAQVEDPGSAATSSRGELIMRLREFFDDARIYARNRAAFERAQARPFSASRKDLEAIQPVLNGTMPLLVGADSEDEIDVVLRLAKEYNLKIMIGGGAEAWMLADRLAAAHVPVLTGAMNNIPESFSRLGQRQENAALLRRAGVTVLLVGNAGGGDEETFNVRNIKQEAGNAVAYGMSWDDALRSITLAPAEVFGVADRIGSLAAGKDADVVVWSGDPFDPFTRAEHVFVKGSERHEVNRQKLLTERYKTLPPVKMEGR